MSELFIAAGGGGDPLGAAITAAALGVTEPTIATYAWERPEVDPTPGPLGAADFDGLERAAEGPLFSPRTRPVGPAGSTLPRLAGDLPGRLVLMDPTAGLRALAEQVFRMASCGYHRVHVVDIGGDVLTHGDEPTLASPLPDAMVLAACRIAGVDATVYVAAPGADGEVPRSEVVARSESSRITPGAYAVEAAGAALSWHPSEASALFAAAIEGERGTVRTVTRSLELTDDSAGVRRQTLDGAIGHNVVAQALVEKRPGTLEEAADLSAGLTGLHEIERERQHGPPHGPQHGRPHERQQGPHHERRDPDSHRTPPDSARPLTSRDTLREALRTEPSDASHATFRFAARALGLPWEHIPALRNALSAKGPLLTLARTGRDMGAVAGRPYA
ncbi:DUF1152 domain-containing protein [Streptomyces armeniacus]|uniref:DUF1152 domain-containing protein n=1 Tax=Streptomyces armeniacus TaxID=83291 RepID=A0A345XMK7_9ACTN|nr:DUF1152 domain-containing protein [Streptomyces armeniacus]AXK32873.1 DUF1152 domain-containing protein [Streptomyces armeniacus]